MSRTSARSSDRRAVVAATAAAALLIIQQVAARAVRDTLFLSAFQARSLPFAMMGSALVGFASADSLSRGLARRSPSRVVPGAALLSAVVLALLWPLGLVAPRTAAVLVYLQVAAFGGVIVSGFWSMVNERFDPFTARRVMGRIGTGAAAGGVAGGLLAWTIAQLLPVTACLLVLAALHGLAFLVLRRLAREDAAPRREDEAPALGLSVLLRVPYLRQIALVIALGSLVEAIVDFVFKAQSQARFASGGALLGPLGLFHAGMSVVSLLLQATIARKAVERLGIAGTVALRPALTALGTVTGSFLPRFETATLARGAHEALTNSLFRSGYELLYTPVPETEKRRVKAVVDVAVDRVGTLVGSGLVLAVLAVVPGDGQRPLFVLATLVSLGAVALSHGLQRGYVRTLERSLLDGAVRIDPSEVVDRATQLTLAHTNLIDREALLRQIEEHRTLHQDSLELDLPPLPGPSPAEAGGGDTILTAIADLRSGDAAAVRRALLAFPEPPPLVAAALVPLLASDELFAEVATALRRSAPLCTGLLLDALEDADGDPVVRRRVPRVLKGCPTRRAAAGLEAVLDDPSFEVRAASAVALAGLNERSAVVTVARTRALELVRRELDSGVPAPRQLPHIHALLSLVLEREPLQIAWTALGGRERALRGTALEYLSNVLPDDVFPRLVSLFGAVMPPPAPRRPIEQVAHELRVSSAALRLERVPWREGDA